VNTARDYYYSAPERDSLGKGDGEGEEADETESLIPLLKKVLDADLGVNAISTGAILSTYQRTRVESIALRLGLTPLSYLWQYPYLPPYSQSGLLHDMAAVGQDARIIKVASGGLDESFLWQNVADSKTIARLGRAMARFGGDGDGNGAVLGEGGEFETLAVDGPGVLWKKRIEVESDGVIRGDGGTFVFRGKGARVVEKDFNVTGGLGGLRIPEMWDDEFKKIFDDLSTASFPPLDELPTHSDTAPLGPFSTHPTNTSNTSSPSTILALSNLTGTSSTPTPPTTQLATILTTLTTHLTTASLSPSHIIHTTLLLRRMSDFTTLNPIYGSLFSTPNPPSRVTISCGSSMPAGVDVMLSVLVFKGKEKEGERGERDGLHVQSRSYWAPANIGPYSQAINIPLFTLSESDSTSQPEAVYIAGQIPLHPSSMSVYNDFGFLGQAVLALQHLWRMARARGVCWWTVGVAYVSSSSSYASSPWDDTSSSAAYASSSETSTRIQIAQTTWKAIHAHYLSPTTSSPSPSEDGNDIDPWDALNLRTTFSPPIADTTYRSPIPDPSALVSVSGESKAPPCFVVQVESLPRDVDIEWHSTGLAGCKVSTSSSSSYTIKISNAQTLFFSLEISRDDSVGSVKMRLRDAVSVHGDGDVIWEHATLYATPALSSEFCSVIDGLQWVPSKRVWGEGGKEVVGVIVGRCSVKT
jgi:diphthine-ammonia ligase